MSAGTTRPARQGVDAAVVWTLAQHGAFFCSAWLISACLGARPFGAWSQALALASVATALVPLRLEYAGQLQARAPRARRLFAAARELAWLSAALGGLLAAGVLGLAGLGAEVLGAQVLGMDAPAWLAAGALAVAPLALLHIRAAAQAREGRVASAAALRALPALLMLALQLPMCLLEKSAAVAWSVPAGAWLAWALVERAAGRAAKATAAAGPGAPSLRLRHLPRQLRAHWRFVRAEWPGLALNTIANHGQVLLVGLLAGDAAAGAIALGLRAAMLPTSLLGLAWADSLRARVIAADTAQQVRRTVRAALLRLALLSLPLHAALLVAAPQVVPWFFPALGQELVLVVCFLLPLGAVRLVANPVTFIPAWRGWLGTSVLLQALLCAAALAAATAGLWWGGVVGVAVLYAGAGALVYGVQIALALWLTRAQA